mmetsp:Transcript_18006/g.68252  ORF Transcript_18006/g.68252 Transcript_18006/m.68252 type:complete len:239 (+) Transcript_18006:1761-2477(+)|eukprot:scaffold7601_cov267-Pinguiococcus_pyrenoidosus.AAC.3
MLGELLDVLLDGLQALAVLLRHGLEILDEGLPGRVGALQHFPLEFGTLRLVRRLLLSQDLRLGADDPQSLLFRRDLRAAPLEVFHLARHRLVLLVHAIRVRGELFKLPSKRLRPFVIRGAQHATGSAVLGRVDDAVALPRPVSSMLPQLSGRRLGVDRDAAELLKVVLQERIDAFFRPTGPDEHLVQAIESAQILLDEPRRVKCLIATHEDVRFAAKAPHRIFPDGVLVVLALSVDLR